MTDPRVEYLASKALAVANFVNQTPVRVALVIIGVGILIWGWRPFWSLRHRLRFEWRTLLGEVTWISRDKAIELVRQSQWARSRKRRNEKPTSQFAFNLLMTNPEADEMQRMFYRWCVLALDGFSTHEPSAVRNVTTSTEYDEAALKNWLNGRYENDVISEFGQPI
jgi:hypothetical protein